MISEMLCQQLILNSY